VRQPHSLETGRDAFVAVFTRAAFLAFDLELSATELASTGEDHIVSLTLSLGLMVSFELSVAVGCAYG
jgi:hypothetical protein